MVHELNNSKEEIILAAAWESGMDNAPLHGKSPETARPFVPVQGAHDMYKIGEYAVFEDALYKCVQDTAYSPADYAPAWEIVT